MDSRRRKLSANNAANTTPRHNTIVMKSEKPSMPTAPPAVLNGPVCDWSMFHHSSESQPCTRAHIGNELIAAATAIATVVIVNRPFGSRFFKNEENVSVSNPPTNKMINGSSASQSIDGPATCTIPESRVSAATSPPRSMLGST